MMTIRTERFSHALLEGVALHLADSGRRESPLVVLLHGGGANLHWWDHLVPALATHHRVVALDFRGHGDSDHPEALEVGAFHRDLEGLLAHLERPAHALVGHSLGAHVALHHAAHHGDVDKLVLIEPSRGAGRRERRRSRLALAARRTYESRADAVDRFRFLPDSRGTNETLRRHVAEHSVREEADGRFGFKFDPRWFGIPAAERPNLSQVRADTLIIRGQESTLLSAAGAAELCDEIPHARLVEIAGAAHNVHIDEPDEVLLALEGHLRGDGPSDSREIHEG